MSQPAKYAIPAKPAVPPNTCHKRRAYTPEPPPPEAKTFSPKQACVVLGVSYPTIDRRLRAGDIPFVWIGGLRRIPASWLLNVASAAKRQGGHT